MGLVPAGCVAVLAVIAVAFVFVILAEERARDLRIGDYFNTIALAQNAYQSDNTKQLKALLERCPTDLRSWEWRYLKGLADRSALSIAGHTGEVTSVEFSPDGRWLLSAGRQDRTLRLWDADGDGKQEVLVTSTRVELLDGDGTVLWEQEPTVGRARGYRMPLVAPVESAASSASPLSLQVAPPWSQIQNWVFVGP